MEDKPLASVIIPCYNYGKFISATIESVLNQTYKNIEIIIIDDGSTDNTKDVCMSFSDKRIKYFYQKNSGANYARNFGLEKSRGKFVSFLDSDDLWLPTKLEKQINLFRNNNNLGLVYSLYAQFESESKTIIGSIKTKECYRGKIIKELYLKNFIGSPTVLIKRNVFENVGNFEDDNEAIDDWLMWTKISNSYEIDYVPEILALYRIHSGAINSQDRSVDKFYDLRIKYSIKVAKLFPILTPLLKKQLYITNYIFAKKYYYSGLKNKSLKLFFNLLMKNPLNIRILLFIIFIILLPSCSIEKHNKARINYINGKIFLFTKCERKKAFLSFLNSIYYSPLEDVNPYIGLILCFAPNFVLNKIKLKYFENIYNEERGILDSGQFVQY